MALPLPKVVYDVGPGGGIITGMRGANALTQSNLENAAKRIENEYLPLKTKADAASKLAYAKLVGPQFLAKLFGNENIFANFPEEKRKGAIQDLFNAGSQRPAEDIDIGPIGQQNANPFKNGLLGLLVDKLTGGQRARTQMSPSSQQEGRKFYPVMNQPNLSSVDRQNISTMQPGESYVVQGNEGAPIQNAPSDNEEYGAVNKASPEYVDYISRHGNTIPQPSTPSREPTTAENVANYRSIIKEGEILGTERGKAISDIGKEQLGLSNSGVILDRLTGIVENPKFRNMRSEIPFFQDRQLSYLAKTGTREQQDLIGDFISTAQAFKASTVNSFKGKALEKEFNLADKIKIDENDTIGVAEGKLRSLKTLKEIAQTKNDIILDLMSGPKHLNLGPATKEANKMIDYKAIEKEVDNLLKPQPTENDIQYMMKKRNLPRSEIVKQLRAKGYPNVS